MLEHSAARHVDYLRQCLRQDKAPIGFLLSAGCGVAIEASGAPLIPDIAGMTAKISGSLADSEQGTAFAALLATFDGSSPNIEALLSRTRALAAVAGVGPVHGLDAECLQRLDVTISDEIAKLVGVDLPAGGPPRIAASQPGPARPHDRRRWSYSRRTTTSCSSRLWSASGSPTSTASSDRTGRSSTLAAVDRRRAPDALAAPMEAPRVYQLASRLRRRRLPNLSRG